MAVTPHHYTLPLRSIVNQGYSPSMHTPDPVETFTLCLTGDLRVCSLSSWDPHPSPFRCPLLCFLLSLPIRKFTHTQILSFYHMMCILIAAISLLCQCESQSFPTWPFLREQTSGDTILTVWPFLFGYWLPSLYFSRVTPSGVAEHISSFDSASFFDSASYLVRFSALIQFLTGTGTEKTVLFSCFLHLLRLSGI